MAAPDVVKVQGATGILYWGGTALGLATEIALIPIQRTFAVRAEEYAGAVVEEYDLGRDWLCTCLVRGFDADMLARLFPSITSGVVSDGTDQSSSVLPLSARSGVLTFTPRDASHHGFVLRRALPRVADGCRIPFGLHGRVSFAAAFRGVPDASGDAVSLGPTGSL
jgi:hypothetical protein